MNNKNNTNSENPKESLHFLEQIIEEDIKNKVYQERVHTRFPPEPNGYLHIGHAKSICLNFGLAEKYKGKCNLRFDDTNPTKEEVEYVNSIKEDIKWLGFQWDDKERYASDYFPQLYTWAIELIKKEKAYVCDMSQEEMSIARGTPTKAGDESPYRNRSVEENLNLFEKMKAGEFQNGEKSLRAKIDMTSPNMHMRDPVLYRILHSTHHRTGDEWCIYPMYDYAHGQSDYIEGITHSVCTLEFEVHRPLYEWLLDQIIDTEYRPKQREFARLNITYTVMSKRKLLQLVEEKHVSGWDDPRMPTISGFRRRGFTANSIKVFADKVGIAKRDNLIDVSLLEYCIREDLNKKAERRLCVLDPLKVIITNYPEEKTEMLSAPNNQEDEAAGKREIPFSRELFIEKEDFMEEPPRKFFRLGPGREVRLKYAYFITCNDVLKNDKGEVVELHCTYDPESKGGKSPDGRKVKGTMHWVDAKEAKDIEIRLYDRLFLEEEPDKVDEGKSFTDNINPDSLSIITAKAEPSISNARIGQTFQFERKGYFCVDKNSTKDKIVYNRTISLRDSWAKLSSKK
jgi:glutaminyl-tRNA synthetase